MISGIPIAHKAKKGVITSLEEINLDRNISFKDKVIVKNAIKECLDTVVIDYFYNEGHYGNKYNKDLINQDSIIMNPSAPPYLLQNTPLAAKTSAFKNRCFLLTSG